MRRIVLIVVLMWGGVAPGAEDNYNELITKVIRACEDSCNSFASGRAGR